MLFSIIKCTIDSRNVWRYKRNAVNRRRTDITMAKRKTWRRHNDTEYYRLNSTNPTINRQWIKGLPIGKQFLHHSHRPSCYFSNTSVIIHDRWKDGFGCDYGKRNISEPSVTQIFRNVAYNHDGDCKISEVMTLLSL